MRKYLFLAIVSLIVESCNSVLADDAAHPATIGQTPDSFAMQLHYPAKERASGTQGAVKFYCEVGPDGRAGHISTVAGKGAGHFGTIVETALRHGRFTPATLHGKPTTVLVGGTVLFLMNAGHPTIAVTLATAEGERVVSMSNYVQPQMLDSDAFFRRKIFAHRDKYDLRSAAHPGAVLRVHVDADGKVTRKEIASESPPNGGRGRLLLDVVDEEHFIPAQLNGHPIAGDYELAVDFEHLRNPDRDPDVGSLIKRDSY